MNIKGFLIIALCFLISCNQKVELTQAKPDKPYIFILGNAQDAGYPQAGCEKECCKRTFSNHRNKRYVSSIALIDPISNENWIFDATPDFKEQLKLLSNHLVKDGNIPTGIFLTHAHIGHYTGLMNLGREAMATNGIPVYAMPKMKSYLTNNGPWGQLVQLKNIELKGLRKDSTIVLNERISVTPLLVPHRDEYSETVGFIIQSNLKKALFIPDIDKWNTWETDIIDLIKEVDLAFLDATFYKDGEIKGRSMNEIPHPFVEESIILFENLSDKDKKKIHFIHFNHTNPLLIEGSEAQKSVQKKGFKIAEQAEVVEFN